MSMTEHAIHPRKVILPPTIAIAIDEIERERRRAETWKRLALGLAAALKGYENIPGLVEWRHYVSKARVAVLTQRQTEDRLSPHNHD